MGVAPYCHERLYTLGTDVDRRREGMDNGHRKRVSPFEIPRLTMHS